METRLLIGGQQVDGEGASLAVENPATQETVADVGSASPAQVDAAVAAAAEAFPVWSGTPALERGEMLHEVATRLRAAKDELARVMTLEGGKPLIENADEVDWTAAAFDFYAELGRASAGRVIPPIESTQLALVTKEPMGVVGAIVPWNYPLLLLSWKLAPALAAGNTVVAKPSEVTPLSTLMLAPMFDHLPAGALSLLAGAGDVGGAIVADERVDCVAFTGSVATGKKIASVCAERVARMNLEMGGKDPFIVCPDVAGDIEIAARGGAWAAYLNAGQVCTSAERFYVHESVFDDYVAAFVDHTKTLNVGDPFDPATDIGPMVSSPQRDKVVAQVEAAVGAGAELLTGGDRAGHDAGHFYAPAVVTGLPAETDLLREETFGPVAPIVPGEVAGRGDRAGQRHPLRPGRQRVHARPGDRRALHARAAGGDRVDQRPPDRQRRGPLRRLQAVGPGPRAGPGGPGGLPGDQARAHGDPDRARRSGGTPTDRRR